MLAEYNVGSITAKMKAEASGWSSTIEKMINDADKLEARFKALGGIGAALAAGAAVFVGAGIKQNATIERLAVSYRVLLKDAEAANNAMSYVRKLADTSPYQMEETLDAGRAMLAYGLDLKTYMTDAMNLAAAMGVQLNDVVRAMGRIKSGDFGEAFERLRDFGISRDLLEGKGLVFDRGGSYQGSVDQALSAIQAIIRERFGGMVEAQAETWDGLISTITDKLKSLNADATADMFAMLKGPLKGFKDWLEGLDEPAAKAVGGIVQLLGVLGLLVATGSAIMLWDKKVSGALAGVGLAAKTLLANPVFLTIAAIATLVIAIGTISSASKAAKKAMQDEAVAARQSADDHDTLAKRLGEVSDQLKTAKPGSEKYNALQKEQQELTQKLCEIYPELNKYKTKENTLRQDGIDKLEEEIRKERELAALKAENARKSINLSIAKAEAALKSNQETADFYEAQVKRINEDLKTPDLSAEDASMMRNSLAEYQASLRVVGQQITDNQAKIKSLKAELATFDTALAGGTSGKKNSSGSSGTSEEDKALASQRDAAFREIRDSVLDALKETEKREIATLNDRYAEYEKLGLKTIEVDGKTYTLKEAKEIELAAIHKKYEDERLAITRRVQDEIDQLSAKSVEQQIALLEKQKQQMIEDDVEKAVAEEWLEARKTELIEQQAERERAIMEGLQRDLLQLQKDGQDKELALLALDQAAEKKRAEETIENADARQKALDAIDEKYEIKRRENINRYAREAADAQARIELAELDYQHQYKLISDEEYYGKRVELAKANAERMKAEHGAESAEYKEALTEITQAEYESIIAREKLETDLTATTLKEVEIRLTAQVLSGELSKEQADATMAALALIRGKLTDITKDETAKAEENLKTIQAAIQNGLSTILKDFAHGEKSIAEIWEDMLNRMLDSFIDFVAKLAAQKFAALVLKLIPGLSLEGGGIVPDLSVASAAGGMMTGSFSGGVPAILHEKEMVLPKNISQFILDTMAQTGGGAQGPQAVFQISAVDGSSVQRMLYEQRDLITGILNQAWKRNSPIRRGG